MAWTYTQNFDSLTNGNLTGQDSWSGHSNFQVQSSVVFGGSGKAISSANADGISVARAITATATGKVNVWMRASDDGGSAATAYFILRDSTGGRAYVRLNSGVMSSFNNDGTPAYDTLQVFLANTWYKITVEFDSTSKLYSIWVNDVLRGSNFLMNSARTDNISSVSFECDGPGGAVTFYWDNIQPWTASAPTGNFFLVM